MESILAKNKELEGNFKTLTQKYEAEKRLESLSHREIDKEKSTLNIKLEKTAQVSDELASVFNEYGQDYNQDKAYSANIQEKLQEKR